MLYVPLDIRGIVRRTVPAVLALGLLLFAGAAPAHALDRLCDPANEDCRAILEAKDRLHVHLLGCLRDGDARQLHELDAVPSMATWLGLQPTDMGRRDIALARRLERLPAVQRGLESQRLSLTCARAALRPPG